VSCSATSSPESGKVGWLPEAEFGVFGIAGSRREERGQLRVWRRKWRRRRKCVIDQYNTIERSSSFAD